MKYWIATNSDYHVLEVVSAKTEDEASWKLSQMGIYPWRVIEIPYDHRPWWADE